MRADRGRFMVRVGCGVLVLLALLPVFGVPDGWELLVADPVWLAAGMLATVATNLVSSVRWQINLQAIMAERRFALSEIFPISAFTNMLGMTGLGGGFAVATQPMILAGHTGVGIADAGYSVAIDRILDLFILVPLFVATLAYLLGLVVVAEAGLVAAALLGFACIAAFLYPEIVRRALAIPVRLLETLMIHAARLWWRFTGHPVSIPDRHLARLFDYGGILGIGPLVLLTVLRFIGLILRLQCIALAFHIDLPITTLIIGHAILQFGLLVSPTPGALGIAEWGWVAVLVQAGMPGTEAIFLSFAFRVYLTVYVVLVYLLAITWRATTKADFAPLCYRAMLRWPFGKRS